MSSSNNNWLALTEYSNKYRVSVSTLRRRIKRETIRYNLMDGKYYIIDEPLDLPYSSTHCPSQTHESSERAQMKELPFFVEPNSDRDFSQVRNSDGDMVGSLLSELKKAFMLVLQEKEQHILILKEEIADLRTLVRVLEDENKRLQEKCEFLFESSQTK